ncbi:MAG TPA: cation diffusion facilitator family transporter [Polyangiaceae bacterium]|nr:cation diffusion facilitator family transporter [Polyangiaceae bacterium]
MAAEHAHHPGSHAHGHHHHGPAAGSKAPEGRLLAALVLTLGFMAVEAVTGWLAHSLALVSDAGHMFADAGALALALTAQRVASRPRTLVRTYGYRRAETLAALGNGVVLGITAVWVIAEAIDRWRAPAAVVAGPVLAVAAMGFVVNLVAAWLLSRGTDGHNANTRAALAHVASDALGSVAAMASAGLVLVFGWNRADAAAGFIISGLILWGAFRLVAQTVSVLMESVPAGVELADLERTILSTPGVKEVHDLHAWTISDGFDAVTVHVVLDGAAHGTDVAADVGERIRREHHVSHVTVQPEAPHLPPGLHSAERLLRKRKV